MKTYARGLLGLLMLLATLGQFAHAESQTRFKRVPVEYIVALGDPSANSGGGAQSWGL